MNITKTDISLPGLTKGLQIEKFSYPTGHKETVCYESNNICFVTSGSCHEKRGRHSVVVGQPNVNFNPVGQAHTFTVQSDLLQCLSIDLAEAWLDRIPRQASQLEKSFNLTDTELLRLGYKIMAEISQPDEFSSACIEALVSQMIIQCQRTVHSSKETYWTSRVHKALEGNKDIAFTPGSLARHLGVNAMYLTTIFKSESNQTLGEYLRTQKVDAVKELLRSTTMPLVEIAATLNYTDQSHMARQFKQITGLTPLTYRKLIRKN
jgi:AraC-like DNA-binding protein